MPVTACMDGKRDTSLLNVSNSCLLDGIPHKKPLDGLVLGATFAAVGAAKELDMPAVLGLGQGWL